jgi:diguanylate cyclase (GGDEF)-like protein
LIDHDRQWFKSKQGLDVTETPREISFCTYAIQQDTPLIVPNALMHPLFCNNPLVTGEPNIRFYIGVPLKTHDGHNIGTLCAIDTRPRELSEDQIDVLRDLARLVVDEIELRQIATTDSLTGALSRRGFDIEINRELQRANRYSRDLSVIAVDIDHFKAVNDRYGHATGDLVLQTVVAQIKQELRSSDFVGRMGGEEFVIVLPETDVEGARQFAERTREKIAGTIVKAYETRVRVAASLGTSSHDGFDHGLETMLERAEVSISVTASFGISGYDTSDNGWKLMLERADAALYEAKHGGRNRSVCRQAPSAIQMVA